MKTDVVFEFGQRGTGKTTLARSLVAHADRALIFDPVLEYDGFGAKVEDVRALCRILQRHHRKPFRLVYAPRDLTPVRGTREIREFTHFCLLANACSGLTVLADEIHQVVNVQMTNRAFSNLLRFSRHRCNTIIAVSHRPTDVPRLLTTLATKLYVFRTHEPRDVAYLRQIIGPAAEQVKDLPDLRYLCFDSTRNAVSWGEVTL